MISGLWIPWELANLRSEPTLHLSRSFPGPNLLLNFPSILNALCSGTRRSRGHKADEVLPEHYFCTIC